MPNYDELLAEEEKKRRWKEWTAARVAQIHQRVTAHDVLTRNGYTLRGYDSTEQISCPFHGQDTRKSARVYAPDANGRTGVWCYFCNEQWDCIKLWRKFNDFTGKFSALLFDIEQAYGLSLPENKPEFSEKFEDDNDYSLDELRHLAETCDHRMIKGRHAFDMDSYFKLSVAIDRVRYQAAERTLSVEKGKEVLRTILDKIGTRIRACPED